MWTWLSINVCLLSGSRTHCSAHGRRAAWKPLSGGTDPAAAESWCWSQHPQPGERPARSFTAERRQRRESERFSLLTTSLPVVDVQCKNILLYSFYYFFNSIERDYTQADTPFSLSHSLSLSSSSSWRRKVPPLGGGLHPYRTKSDQDWFLVPAYPIFSSRDAVIWIK